MHIQPMSASNQWRRTSLISSNSAFGANTGIIMCCWILVAVLTVCERIGDTFISWVPMYSEAKLAFYVYLWYPKTKGTAYVYDSFFRPYISKHETDIDRNLAELRIMAGDMAVLYWQRAANYVQTRTFDILQYIASQSTPKPRPSQLQHIIGLIFPIWKENLLHLGLLSSRWGTRSWERS
ncbi:TB2/DP1/HVA22-related protein [Cynara cardunculus var. scolymus]|uniref:HVA22-like protein n=1 Tax=Cynara cardunculus var. scolymus TaxID=59895 RepID=A0A118JTJ6_CYNCS|nr:TB2/DP1/HVA22-related protein [Cynara cardunculus var. scolymus]